MSSKPIPVAPMVRLPVNPALGPMLNWSAQVTSPPEATVIVPLPAVPLRGVLHPSPEGRPERG